MAKKKKTRFQKITMIFVWLMIFATVASLVLSAVVSLMN
ncbi:DUF4044 domain-containing protein [Lentilactobacillus laojiaonis]|nr:DUF4044 domain-containing protein [Lentilactobacillus laojiaonis]UDM32466.1 DUF4044 domain-containing protein [Lentilactobacillus laojiaonis]